jgi:hypothetical protein
MAVFSCYPFSRVKNRAMEEFERFASKPEAYKLIHPVRNDFGLTHRKMQMSPIKTHPEPNRFLPENWPGN